MALNSLGLGLVFTAKDLATAQIRKLTGSFRKLDDVTEQTTSRFEKGVKGMAVGLGARDLP